MYHGPRGVPWPGVYRGPPKVYRGPCMKITRWKTPIIFTDRSNWCEILVLLDLLTGPHVCFIQAGKHSLTFRVRAMLS